MHVRVSSASWGPPRVPALSPRVPLQERALVVHTYRSLLNALLLPLALVALGLTSLNASRAWAGYAPAREHELRLVRAQGAPARLVRGQPCMLSLSHCVDIITKPASPPPTPILPARTRRHSLRPGSCVARRG